MNNTMHLTLDLKITRIADLLCSGFEGGIGYWARIEDYKEPTQPIDLSAFQEDNILGKQVYPHIHYPLSPDAAVIIKDIHEDKEYVLDIKAVRTGLNIFAEQYPRHFGNWLSENDDATTGDVFIQCCVLGKALYG